MSGVGDPPKNCQHSNNSGEVKSSVLKVGFVFCLSNKRNKKIKINKEWAMGRIHSLVGYRISLFSLFFRFHLQKAPAALFRKYQIKKGETYANFHFKSQQKNAVKVDCWLDSTQKWRKWRSWGSKKIKSSKNSKMLQLTFALNLIRLNLIFLVWLNIITGKNTYMLHS